MDADNMQLPAGKTCSQCGQWERCKALISSLTGKETTCDWNPSRFVESNPLLPVFTKQLDAYGQPLLSDEVAE